VDGPGHQLGAPAVVRDQEQRSWDRRLLRDGDDKDQQRRLRQDVGRHGVQVVGNAGSVPAATYRRWSPMPRTPVPAWAAPRPAGGPLGERAVGERAPNGVGGGERRKTWSTVVRSTGGRTATAASTRQWPRPTWPRDGGAPG